MRKLFFVGMLLAGLFCGTSAVLADKTPLQKLEEFEQKMGPKILVTEKVVLVERTQKGLIFIGDYDVLDKLKAIANVLGSNGIRVVEYRGLEDGGVEVFSLFIRKKQKNSFSNLLQALDTIPFARERGENG